MSENESAATAAKDRHRIIFEIEGATTKEVIAITFNIFDRSFLDPISLVLPSGQTIPWRRPLAAKYIRNEISEQEYINQSNKEV